MENSGNYLSAVEDFYDERRMAALQEVLGRISGKSIDLYSFDDVTSKLRITGGIDRGLNDIPVASIAGSVSRYSDFTRNFLPRHDSDLTRWAKVKAAVLETQVGLPPIEVYQVGDTYFVKDGHHRVSVARRLKFETIQAYVIEIQTRVPFSSNSSPDELILAAEYAEFLERTRIDLLYPQAVLKLTVPGYYQTLLEHIQVHQYFMGLDQKRDITWEEAVRHWYEEVYLPVQQAIQERGILREFPGRTETDLYVWVSQHKFELEKELGWNISPEVAAADLANKSSPRLSRKVQRLGKKVYESLIPDALETNPPPGQWRQNLNSNEARLFRDILVPVNGLEEGWNALDQALVVARMPSVLLKGLYVVPPHNPIDSETANAVRDEFRRRCQNTGVDGSLAVVSGEVARQICEWAVLTDLVILNLAHPPAEQIFLRLESGFRTIIRRCPRPLLAVPGKVSPLDRLLLAYDGSPKAKEALYLSAYLAGRWKASLAVLTTLEPGRVTRGVLKSVEKYFEERGVESKFITMKGAPAENILSVVESEERNLILMGGYGFSPVVEAVLGSTVDQVLRSSNVPVLICQ
ncbi:MAG TPA: universal stress protein [Anaerolineaceae bacterium]|nr:universal stress protein [Anaerolineaceae bacterium]